jgi:hypothetical protein
MKKNTFYGQPEGDECDVECRGPGAVRSSDEEYSVEIADRLVSSSRYDFHK